VAGITARQPEPLHATDRSPPAPGHAGPGPLRQAILDDNATPGPDAIAYDVGGGGVQTIRLAATLPEVTDPVVIDGTTLPGSPGQPLTVLHGRTAGFGVGAPVISAGSVWPDGATHPDGDGPAARPGSTRPARTLAGPIAH
jgi:hypothetical protein